MFYNEFDWLLQILSRIKSTWKLIFVSEGKACVYILVLHGRDKNTDKVYVGETESIRQRLRQHVSQRKGTKITALVTTSPNKSSARGTEALLISRLKQEGYDIEGGGSDDMHVLFASG